MSNPKNATQKTCFNRIELISDKEFVVLASHISEVTLATKVIITINDETAPFCVATIGTLTNEIYPEEIILDSLNQESSISLYFNENLQNFHSSRPPFVNKLPVGFSYWSFPLRSPQAELLGCLSVVTSDDADLQVSQKRFLVLAVQFLSAKLSLKQQLMLNSEREILQPADLLRLKTLDEVAGSIAHEVNNPLNIILGRAAQILEMAKRNQLPIEKVIRISENIIAVTKRISKIIAGVKSIIHSDKNDPFEKIGVRELIDSTLQFCEEKIRENGVELRIGEIEEGLFVECRHVQISQALLNLIMNALDAIADLDEKWISIDVLIENNSVQFLVTDSGNGIPADHQQKVFEPFFTTKTAGKGTGLGLSIARKILGSHGGELELDRAHPNTRFQMRLPRVQPGNSTHSVQ